jgi:two-component system OmpR family sensor kinase
VFTKQPLTHPLIPPEITARIQPLPNRHRSVELEQHSHEGEQFLSLFYPLWQGEEMFLILTRDVTQTNAMLERILRDILLINLSAIFLVLFYALFLSRMLLVPIKILASKHTTKNETFLKSVDIVTLPEEFLPLGKSINRLIERIQTFVKYQKELFIGTAHELKTPLAVLKTKNEVTLLRPRENEKYIEALRNNIQAVDEMNAMIGAILEIGRQEGAQFEEPQRLDLVAFLKERVTNFRILAHQEEIAIALEVDSSRCELFTQKTLLIHILQNFVQNAIKFSPKHSTITIRAIEGENDFAIFVEDEGEGIDETKDLFAPFKRFGNKAGTGLGLFLAKGAADALGASIRIANRSDKQGTIASLVLPKTAPLAQK